VKATWLGLAAGFLTSIAVLPQVVRTWRRKQAVDLSVWQPLILIAGMMLWLFYGIVLEDTPLIVANSFSVACYLFLLVMKLVYDRRLKYLPQSGEKTDHP
jgi:MtN3 and saliva related transmembrane protein